MGGQIAGSAAVAKFLSSGAVSYNYGNFGKTVLPDCVPGGGYTPTYPLAALDLRFQSTGKLLVSTMLSFGNWGMSAGVHRLTVSGHVDTTFQDPSSSQMCNTVVGTNTWIDVMANDYFYGGSRRFFPDGATDESLVPTASGSSGELQPGDGKLLLLSYYPVAKPGYFTWDSKIQLQRMLP